MKKYNLVELINEVPTLNNRGIKVNTKGLILNETEPYLVQFFNDENMGDFAYAKVNKTDLKIVGALPKELTSKMDKYISNQKIDLDKCFVIPKIKEYDCVKLLVEKEEYAKCGVHKGDKGCVISEYAMDNTIEVDFTYVKFDEDNIENYLVLGDCLVIGLDEVEIVEDDE